MVLQLRDELLLPLGLSRALFQRLLGLLKLLGVLVPLNTETGVLGLKGLTRKGKVITRNTKFLILYALP